MLNTFCGATDEALAEISEEMKVRKTTEVFLLFALGSQFDHLIRQALAKLGVFCLVADPGSVTAKDVAAIKPTGILLSGGPASVTSGRIAFDNKIFDLGIPVLGICLGFQLWAKHAGFRVASAIKREFGKHWLTINDGESPLFHSCPIDMMVLQSHGDRVERGLNLSVLAATENSPVAAAKYKHLWGVQFHPEVTDTEYGTQILKNFCFAICKAKTRFPAAKVAKQKIASIRKQIGDKKVLLALSGGSDSSTVCYLLKHAVESKPGQVRAVYIMGIDRPDDEAFVRALARAEAGWLDLKVVDATEQFLAALAGKTACTTSA